MPAGYEWVDTELIADKAEDIALNYLGIGMMLQSYIQDRQERLINLQRYDLLGTIGQRTGQCAEPGTDFQHAVFLCDKGKISKLFKQELVFNKVLSEAMLVVKLAVSMVMLFQINTVLSDPISDNALLHTGSIRIIRLRNDVMRTPLDFQIGLSQILSDDPHAE